MKRLSSIVRPHILAIAGLACLTFGWLLTGEHPWLVAVFAVADWFLINLLNRVTDIAEDVANRVPGAESMQANRRAWVLACVVVAAGSFAASAALLPALTPWRVGVQLIGLGYNYRVVPWPGGRRRFKEVYFLKNFGSAVIFVLTGFVYPVVAWGGAAGGALDWAMAVVLCAFFVPFEITYEILYDLRDVDGDRAADPVIPTYPVVHGPDAAIRIIDGLLAASALVMAGGLAAGWVGVREGLMLAAPALQFAFYRRRLRKAGGAPGAGAISHADCTAVTWMGAGLLAVYLIGTHVWLQLGLPANVFLR